MTTKTILLTLLAACLMLWSCDTKTKNVDSCGDGFVDPGEQCDGSNLNGTTCASLLYYKTDGVLACNSECRFVTTDCGTARCGDGMIQENENEQCEGSDLNGQSCQSLLYDRGTLSCSAGCRFDVTDCVGAGACGDSIIQAPEQCDGNQLGDQTCQGLGYYAGSLRCGSNCQFELGSCSGRCGDGSIDALFQEECDGLNLNLQTCVIRGFYGGDLGCAENCRSYDETNCAAVGRCGDGVIQLAHGEQCDGAALDAQTCVTRGFGQASGALGCTIGCAFDETGCVPKSTNANLATLTVSSGTLSPAFSANTTSYSVAATSVTLTVTVSAADPYATVAIAPPQPMTLTPGANAVSVTVTAESGAQKVYSVIVTLNNESPNVGTMIYVPTGTFQRDATATNLSTVSAFRMSRYEITRAQWTAVTGWPDPSEVTYSSGTNDPVQMVNWYNVITFCNKLSLLEGLTPVYAVSGVNFSTLTYAEIPTSSNANWNEATANWAANGYRLPTEMEWMWAAMGADLSNPGVTNTTGYAKEFAGSTGSNSIGDYAVFGYNTSETGRTTTQRSNPVGSKLPNELGFHDLSGNIWEWNWDWYGTYPTGTVTDYRGPASGPYRVLRGGNWSGSASYCAVANRSTYSPYDRFALIGFRVVRP